MIIVEGMDNSGKTQLSEHIAEKFKLRHIKSPKDRTGLVDKALTLLVLNPQAVMDRFSVISEIIYGPILRGKTEFDGYVGQWYFYMEKLAQCKPLVIYCRPPKEKIFDFGHQEQMEGVIEHRKELLKAYDAFMASWDIRLQIIRYDFMLPEARTTVEIAVRAYLLRMKNNEH